MSKETFHVWDELNTDPWDESEDSNAWNAESAAIRYAVNNKYGFEDGLYHPDPQPIMVRAPDGSVTRFMIGVEMVPSFVVVSREEGVEARHRSLRKPAKKCTCGGEK